MLVLLPLMAQHTYTITVFLVSNKEYLMQNCELYDIKTSNII